MTCTTRPRDPEVRVNNEEKPPRTTKKTTPHAYSFTSCLSSKVKAANGKLQTVVAATVKQSAIEKISKDNEMVIMK